MRDVEKKKECVVFVFVQRQQRERCQIERDSRQREIVEREKYYKEHPKKHPCLKTRQTELNHGSLKKVKGLNLAREKFKKGGEEKGRERESMCVRERERERETRIKRVKCTRKKQRRRDKEKYILIQRKREREGERESKEVRE